MRPARNSHVLCCAGLGSSVLILAFLGVLAGCNISPSEHRLYLVLADETDSFALHEKSGIITKRFWPEVLPLIQQVADQLSPGDQFAMIGIDEHGFDEEDVILPFTVLDEAFLKAKLQKDGLRVAVGGLRPRKDKYRATDILGALRHAAYFAQSQPNRKTIVFCFSDMRQEPVMPTLDESRDLSFPKGSEGYFFYVDAAGYQDWDRIVSVWEPILHRAGLDIYTGNSLNFFQRGESEVRLRSVLSSLGAGTR